MDTANLTFTDCETTGTDPTRHAVWEIAIITSGGGFEWVLELTREELAAAEPMALSVGNFYERYGGAQTVARDIFHASGGNPNVTDNIASSRWVSTGMRRELAQFLAVKIGRSHLVGAVPGFDARFVGDFMRSQGYPPSWHYHLIDVEALAAGVLQTHPPWKSKDLYSNIGIDPAKFDEHTAMGDAKMAKAIYEQVMSGRAATHVSGAKKAMPVEETPKLQEARIDHTP